VTRRNLQKKRRGRLITLGPRAVYGWGAALLLAFTSFSQTIRVTSWNLQSKAGQSIESLAQLQKEAVETLKKLQPDVILLQGVRDWEMCSELAGGLRPAEYNVAICSALHTPLNLESNTPQVAILTKERAYFTLTEPWRFQGESKLPGGYTFAAFQNREQRVGVFNLQMGAQQMLALTARQLVDELKVIRRWEANRVDVFIIAGTLNTFSENSATVYETLTHLLGEAGFADGLIDLPPTQRSTLSVGNVPTIGTADFILVETNAVGINPQIVPTSVSEHYPVTCEVEVKPQSLVTTQTENAQITSGSNAPAREQPTTQSQRIAQLVITHLPSWRVVAVPAGIFGGVLLLCALIWIWTRTRRAVLPKSPALARAKVELDSKASSASYTVIIAPRSVTGSAEPGTAQSNLKPVIQVEPPGVTQTHSAGWQQRALTAEQQVAQAEAALRAGLLSQLSQWLKQKLVRRLMADRAQLLEAQEEAARRALKVDERLNRIERQIQQQNQAYERRIEELNRQLVAAKEENRELIRNRIAQIKMEMEQARVRLLAKAQEENEGVEG